MPSVRAENSFLSEKIPPKADVVGAQLVGGTPVGSQHDFISNSAVGLT